MISLQKFSTEKLRVSYKKKRIANLKLIFIAMPETLLTEFPSEDF